MRQLIAEIRTWFSRSTTAADAPSQFVNLAPTDMADEAGVYAKALKAAIKDPKVSNIALTGPYGSGKSSIIQSFLKQNEISALQISLAAFLPEAIKAGADQAIPDRKVSKQEIERSILQQMLYGADANKLPFSRFKRIRSPGRLSALLSLYALIGAASVWHLFQKRVDILDGAYFLPLAKSNWPHFVWFAVGASFVWVLLHQVYKASFGISLKSISLKDIEITPAAIAQESILNRHLDEIIYFFQSTKYDLVIIEDLDRFDDSEIFVTLREINKLINENAGVKRTIRFLYALRDDMFINTDRTKFFEFIIPVIPIINSSNSIDKMLEQGKRLALDDRLDRQFLREVSRYLNDLRLIQNIFNEYAIYAANLETDGGNDLNATKLLAILIYKNVFPKEFEALHRGKGNLARILDRHDEFIVNAEADYKARIERIEGEIDVAERQIPSDLLELRRIYAMAVIERIPGHLSLLTINGQNWIEISSIAKLDIFDQLIKSSNVSLRSQQGHQGQVNLSTLEAEVDPSRTYIQRKEEIERRGAEFRTAAARKLRLLRTKSAGLRGAKFNEIIRLDTDGLDALFNAFDERSDLARFLILEGHLDDTYYQYTSLFHSGRLSPNDNKYLIKIRGFITPEPGFPIDNPKEVIAAMRDEDFRQSYVLNVKIIDCLLSEPLLYASHIAEMFGYLESEFDTIDDFFTSYYAFGTQVPNFVAGMVRSWAGFIPAILVNPKHLPHLAQLMAHLPLATLEALPEKYAKLPEFLAANLAEILALGVGFEPSRLEALGFELESLRSVDGFPGIARSLFEAGLYTLTIDNLDYAVQTVLGESDTQSLHTRHYTTISHIANDPLTARIEREFAGHLKLVLIGLPDNRQESTGTILAILARNDADFDDLVAFLRTQSAVIPILAAVPARFHSPAFQLGRIAPSWENVQAFLSGEAFDSESLTTFLNMDAPQAALSAEPMPDDEGAAPLHRFLVENDGLTEPAYRTYVRALPRGYSQFPDGVDVPKLQILIEEGRVAFSAEALDFLSAHDDLRLAFAIRNIEPFLNEQARLSIDDDFREALLGSPIGDEHKVAIIRSMDLAQLSGLATRARVVGAILERTGADLPGLSAGPARAIILATRPIEVQVRLFSRYQSLLSDDDVREILAELPRPFSEIKRGYGIPLLENTQSNAALAAWLVSRKIISSVGKGWFGEIRINLFRREAEE
ncbi:putative membrane protein YobI [Sphingomonas glacialis]|uniref:Membrane protein YobI n=1 Tax=Sphingomonas glacialis TaxID=658225 RepID=A0ABQ3LW66_9SPHN|nr:P-loop NTPase fold protein [Sphingomonas glacialis]GHH25059.1 putative membrane protein YobI [Sphingomonas glacialis]